MKKLVLCNILIALWLLANCNGQTNEKTQTNKTKVVGGGCDGCELMYVGIPKQIPSVVTSPGWNEKGQKLILTGNVFQLDGKTPAADVIIYYWQTDNNGYYSPSPAMDERAKRHGHIRGWVKTDKNGYYMIKTIRPAPYPKETMPAHIHLSIKEPDVANEYYSDEINFDDDPLLIPHFKRYPQENRGGSGVVRVVLKDNVQIAEHPIVLGLNIPNYPKEMNSKIKSGLHIGEDQPSFAPTHAFGLDEGTTTCPVCKYGRYHGILYFVGRKSINEDIEKWCRFLEKQGAQRKKELKVYLIVESNNANDHQKTQNQLKKLGIEMGIVNTALTFVPSYSDRISDAYLNKINPDVENTFIIYKHRKIVDKYINLKPTDDNFEKIIQSLKITKGPYFHLPEPSHD